MTCVTADNELPRSIMVLSRVSKEENNQIPQIESGNPVQSQSSVQRDDFLLLLNCVKLKFDSNTSNLLEQMYDFQKCTQCSSRSGFRIFKIYREVRVLKQSQSALFSSMTNIAISFVFTCVMYVRYQSIQAFVKGFGPFLNRPCKFIH